MSSSEMETTMSHPGFGIDSPSAGDRRDRGLRRVGATTRWLTAAAAAGAVGLGIAYTHLLPGATASQAPTDSAVTTGDQGTGDQGTGDQGTGGQGTGGHGTGGYPSSDDDHAGYEGADEYDDEGAEDEHGRVDLFRPAQPPAPTRQPAQTNTGAS